MSSVNRIKQHKRCRSGLIIFSLLMVVLPVTALAQTIDQNNLSNQELLRQQERERHLRERLETDADVHLPEATADSAIGRLTQDESPCFIINHLMLEDPSDHFHWALAAAELDDQGNKDSPMGRCLGTQGINQLMRRIQNKIIPKGYVTSRVLAPVQNLKSGTLTLSLVPGLVKNINFLPDTDSRANMINIMPLESGDVLNLRDIEQALENFKRTPTVEADIEIVPATATDTSPEVQPGQSDLLVKWQQDRHVRFNWSLDDTGSASTGKYLTSLTLSVDNPLTLHDLAYFSTTRTAGALNSKGVGETEGFTAHYSVPFDYWLLGLTTSANRYDQKVAGASQSYVYKGTSENSELRLSRLIYRDATRKTLDLVKLVDNLPLYRFVVPPLKLHRTYPEVC